METEGGKMRAHGKATGKFGVWLDTFVKKEKLDLHVFYDHGEQPSPNCGKVYAFYGDQPNNENIFAEVDALLANKGNEVVAVIEIEDISSPSPKKILGVIFSIVLANRFSFRHSLFTVTDKTRVFLVGNANPMGKKNIKFRASLFPQIRRVTLPSDNINIQNIEIISEDTLEKAIEHLKERIREILV